MRKILHNRAEVYMYDEYPMMHYEFAQTGSGNSLISDDESTVTAMEENARSLVINAEYNLRGYVDVLPFFPQPDDVFHRQMHLQSFSHMYSLKDYYTSRRDTDSWLLIFVNSGQGMVEYRGNCHILNEGDLFWIDCHETSMYKTEGEFWEHTDIHINGTGVGPLYKAFARRGSPVLLRAQIPFFEADLKALLDAYVTMDAHRTLRTCHAIENMLVHLILAEDAKENSMPNAPRLQNLIRYMHAHYRDALTMDQLAEQAGFSKYYLSREFKKLTGMPPNEYLISLRIEQAKQLLANTEFPAYRVGILSGIENEAYFSRLFHQRTNMTPAEYRKRNKGAVHIK